jgi:hypothetical protein
MKIEINISDFYLDEDDDLEQGLKDYIKRDVIKQVYASIQEKVQKEITAKVIEVVEENLFTEISAAMKTQIESGKIQSRYDRSKEITLAEYTKECFTHDRGYNSFDNLIKELANEFATEMKGRYDLLFASQLVAKMNENGLLKDDIAKLLLTTGTDK